LNNLYPHPNSDKYFMGILIAFEMCFPGKKKTGYFFQELTLSSRKSSLLFMLTN